MRLYKYPQEYYSVGSTGRQDNLIDVCHDKLTEYRDWIYVTLGSQF